MKWLTILTALGLTVCCFARASRVHAGALRRPLARAALLAAHRVTKAVGGAVDRAADSLCHAGDVIQERSTTEQPPLVARSLCLAGRSLSALAGTETLRDTSIGVGGGVNLGFPALRYIGGIGVGGGIWTGSVRYWTNRDRGAHYSDRNLSFSIGASTLVGGVGLDQIKGLTFSPSLPFVGFSIGPRGHSLGFGIPNGPGMGVEYLGAVQPDQFPRGASTGAGISVPVVHLGVAAVYAGVGVSLYYPPLKVVTDAVAGPIQSLRDGTVALKNGVTHPVRTFHQLTDGNIIVLDANDPVAQAGYKASLPPRYTRPIPALAAAQRRQR